MNWCPTMYSQGIFTKLYSMTRYTKINATYLTSYIISHMCSQLCVKCITFQLQEERVLMTFLSFVPARMNVWQWVLILFPTSDLSAADKNKWLVLTFAHRKGEYQHFTCNRNVSSSSIVRILFFFLELFEKCQQCLMVLTNSDISRTLKKSAGRLFTLPMLWPHSSINPRVHFILPRFS